MQSTPGDTADALRGPAARDVVCQVGGRSRDLVEKARLLMAVLEMVPLARQVAVCTGLAGASGQGSAGTGLGFPG